MKSENGANKQQSAACKTELKDKEVTLRDHELAAKQLKTEKEAAENRTVLCNSQLKSKDVVFQQLEERYDLLVKIEFMFHGIEFYHFSSCINKHSLRLW